jgi:hypothetical protein
MAAGDAQRVWFAEMIAKLRAQWRPDMSFEARVELRDDLDAMLQRIRSERRLRAPVLQCPRCGHIGESAGPHVSIRAMLLSLLRFGVDETGQVKALERGWAAYREQNRLDLYGKSGEQASPSVTRCAPIT